MEIEILLATHNGAVHLQEQIDSILNQNHKNWQLILRDDQSSDKTLGIINRYRKLYPNKIRTINDTSLRLGVVRNFSKLLEFSMADYVMFCDQDDMWLPHKIEITLQKMQEIEKVYGSHTGILIHTDMYIGDKNGEIIAPSLWQYQNLKVEEGKSLKSLLRRNVVTGCSMMINKALKDIATPIPQEAFMHDWWLALVASVFGHIDYLDISTAIYRQHGKNDIGARQWGLGYIGSVLRQPIRISTYLNKTKQQAIKFLDIYEQELDKQDYELIQKYIKTANFFTVVKEFL